jgi:plasmid stabilization system protein ParE
MRYRFTAAAEADLTTIWDRIAIDSEASADRYLRRIKDECGALAKSPQAGTIRIDFTKKDVRFWLVDPHRSHFIVDDPKTNPIEIVRVMHGARNLRKLL